MQTKFILVLLKTCFFKSLKKHNLTYFELNETGVYPIDFVKYLRIKTDKNLTWRHQIKINEVAAKVNRANTMLSKIRHFVGFKSLKLIYYAIFETHLNYLLLVWAQNDNSVEKHLA